MAKGLESLKKGDSAIIIDGSKTVEVIVLTVGRKWITVTKSGSGDHVKFSLEDGTEQTRNYYGNVLRTVEQHAEQLAYKRARDAIEALGVTLNYKAEDRIGLTMRIHALLCGKGGDK